MTEPLSEVHRAIDAGERLVGVAKQPRAERSCMQSANTRIVSAV